MTFTFLLFLATVMVYTCKAVVPKTETPITDARWKKVLLRRDRKKKKMRVDFEEKGDYNSSHKPAACSASTCLERERGAVPKGLMGRQRSTTPFLTHHMLKEFSGALWV